mgnify:CR=1 FL=1
MINLPPPHDDLPDYYLGCLLYYDNDGKDNCRWIVYDGHNFVRCPTRRDAMDYINTTTSRVNGQARQKLISARVCVNAAITRLETAALLSEPVRRLLLQRLAVQLRPVLVDLDNIILTKHDENE